MLFNAVAALAAGAASLVAAAPTAGPNPVGGVDTNATSPPPAYIPLSDFDFQSLNLALNQEWIELDLFHYGLSRFSPEEFEAVGITAADQFLIEFMADQEVGHSTLLSNILQGAGAKQCQYKYDFNTVKEFVQFCAVLTRFGESGVYGFLSHLDSRPAADLLTLSISTEARQQMVFRQLSGAFPMPVWFETGISQSMAWTLLSPYLISCPAENPKIEWNIFPYLTIDNNPNLTSPDFNASISTNRTALTSVNETLYFTYDAPGMNVSYNSSYTTALGRNVTNTTTPTYCAFIAQLNATTTPFTSTGNNTGHCEIPGGYVFGDDPIVNGTMFVALLAENIYVTPYNLSLMDDIIVAGPAVLIAG